MASSKTLKQLRREVDTVDERLLALLSKRARIAQSIGKAKNRRAAGVLDAAREREVIRAIRANNPGPLSDAAIEAIFREVIAACRASQQPVTVAFLGPEGTFSHEAALRQFGATAGYQAVATIAEVFAAVEAGRVSHGIVPIENTTEGAVTPTLDGLATMAANILSEVLVKVDHYLLSKDGKAAAIRRIVSHPQPLAQCRHFLAERFGSAELVPVGSTAAAAQMAKQQTRTAAVASRLAAETYGLKVVARSIQNNADNVTRFLVIGTEAGPKPSGKDRTSLAISVRDGVGVLEQVIRPFAANGVNLSMIESRPLPGRPWEYSFFVDVAGHRSEKNVAKAVAEVGKIAMAAKVLGSYPVAE